MGNKPSATQIPIPKTPTQAPPPPPVCGADCQREKQLSGLKTAFEQAKQTKDTDPEGYEQARIAYFTALHGQGWLANEKERIAKNEVEPILTTYTSNYKRLSDEKKSQKSLVSLMSSIEQESADDEADSRYLNNKAVQEANQADVLNRLSQLQQESSTTSTQSYLPLILDVILAILGLFILYMIYTKFVANRSTPMLTAGKRVPR